MRRVVSMLLVIVIAVAASACRGDGPGEDGESPSVRDPHPGGDVPNDEAPVIAGTVVREVVVVSSNANLFHNSDRPPPEPDEGAIADFDLRVETWLNEHLNDLQTGGEGLLEQVAAPGLLDGAATKLISGLTTELASEDRPALEATYDFTIAHAGIPEWIRADVFVVTDESGATEGASFIFVPGDGGAAVLIMAEPLPAAGGAGGGGGSPRPSASEESRG